LWLRDNVSIFIIQFVDTLVVLLLLCDFGIIDWEHFGILLLNGYLFKMLIAMLDTPIIYFIVWCLRKYFDLKEPGEELEIEI